MAKIKFTENDFNETKRVSELLHKMDQIDAEYVNSISDEIFKFQPFFLSVLLGYQQDVTMEELEEIMKIYFLVWECFRLNPKVQKKQVTEFYYAKIQKRNVEMLRYSEGERNDKDKLEIYSRDLQNVKSKTLLAAVFQRLNERLTLVKMDSSKKAAVLIGVKSFIECFDRL